MNLLGVIRIALLDLALHKFRSVLAVLGIIVGVGSVIAVLSISEGQKHKALARFSALGIDNIQIVTQKPSSVGQTTSAESAIAEYGLQRRDLEHIRDHFPMIRYAVGARDMRTKLYSASGRSLDLRVMATEPDYLSIMRSHIVRGRFISRVDMADYKSVCALGADAARSLFAYRNPLGASLLIDGFWYRVVGVVENMAGLKAAGGVDINSYVFIPLATARMLHGDISISTDVGSTESVRVELDAIALQVEEEEAVPFIADRIRTYLAKTHLEKTGKEDYRISVPLDMMRQKAAEQEDYTLLVVSIAGISMIVGGIGIMNIMLANVSDRRKEIGTRRALGARKSDILTQIIIEAATLTCLGGVAGIVLGYAIARVFGVWADTPILVDPQYIARAILGSSLVGIVFGFWPAYQAAKVHPIEALRSD